MIRAKLIFNVDYEEKRIGPIRIETAKDRAELMAYEGSMVLASTGLEPRSDYYSLREFVITHASMYADSVGIPEDEVVALFDTPLEALYSGEDPAN